MWHLLIIMNNKPIYCIMPMVIVHDGQIPQWWQCTNGRCMRWIKIVVPMSAWKECYKSNKVKSNSSGQNNTMLPHMIAYQCYHYASTLQKYCKHPPRKCGSLQGHNHAQKGKIISLQLNRYATIGFNLLGMPSTLGWDQNCYAVKISSSGNFSC